MLFSLAIIIPLVDFCPVQVTPQGDFPRLLDVPLWVKLVFSLKDGLFFLTQPLSSDHTDSIPTRTFLWLVLYSCIRLLWWLRHLFLLLLLVWIICIFETTYLMNLMRIVVRIRCAKHYRYRTWRWDSHGLLSRELRWFDVSLHASLSKTVSTIF